MGRLPTLPPIIPRPSPGRQAVRALEKGRLLAFRGVKWGVRGALEGVRKVSEEELELVKRIGVTTLMVGVEWEPHAYFNVNLDDGQTERMRLVTWWRDACVAQWAAETEAVGEEHVPLVTKLRARYAMLQVDLWAARGRL